jgi:hypothetical protein
MEALRAPAAACALPLLLSKSPRLRGPSSRLSVTAGCTMLCSTGCSPVLALAVLLPLAVLLLLAHTLEEREVVLVELALPVAVLLRL